MAEVSLELLTDEDILDYTKSEGGKERVITDHGDYNLRFSTTLTPVNGGLYDLDMFGSPFVGQCICGHIKQESSVPCPNCGARVYSKEEALRRFARIDLAFYYLNELRFNVFKELFDQIFKDTKIKLEFFGNDLRRNGYAGRSAKKLGIKAFDTCQFTYSKAKNELKVSEFITDEKKCSYEGLLAILEKHFPGYVPEFKRLVNKEYLVLPAAMRPISAMMIGGKKKITSNPLTTWYGIITRFCSDKDEESIQRYSKVIEQFDTPGEKVRYTALLRALLNAGKKQATDLLNTSKKNEARDLYSVRVKNSARLPIVPDAELPVDRIGVPISIAYEMCREGFINYLVKELNFTVEEAKKSTQEEFENPEIQKMFKEYAEEQAVLVNRQPTLHEYSIYCNKIKLFDDYVIHYPIELCGPLNADFDGDTVSLILVPESERDETLKKMSPRYNNIYKKNLKNIFEFNHETLDGLANASEFVPENGEDDLKNPKYFYDDWAKLVKDVEVNRVINYGTPIVFTGKLGNVEYKSKTTTYGRLRISKIIDADLDLIQVGGEPILKPYQRLSGKSAAKLMTYLYGFEDWVEKANELQKFALKVVTRRGVVTFDTKTLYADINTKTYKEIEKICDNKDLTDKQKLLLLTESYGKYQKEIEAEFSDDLKNELDRAGRVKLASIMSMASPSLIVSGPEEKPIITRGETLLSGFSETNYISHAIENRSLLSLKNSGVPLGGYTNRQMGFLLQNYIFKTGQDPDNEGILIPRYVASGRTAPNGKVYPEVSKRNEFDLVPVRSIITKTKGDLDIITPDLFSNRFLKASFPEGSAVGLSAGTSFSESTTQGILGLKHGGHERVADTSGNLYAPKNCTLIEDGKWLILKSGRTEMKYPRPDNWVGIPQESYKEGDLIGSAYHTTSPVYALNAVIKLMNAKGSNGTKYFEKDQVINADCYAYFGGKIRYEENKRGEIEVFVGDTQYVYSPNSLYYYPEGTEIKPLQRICSGVVNMRQVTSDLGDDISSAFNIFRNQYYMLMSSDFSKTGIVSPGDMPEEILEMVFAGLTRIVRNPRTDQVEEIDYLGTQKAILDRESFFTTLSFGWAGKIIDRAVRGDMKIKDDIMTNVVLGLLLHDKLDNATKK